MSVQRMRGDFAIIYGSEEATDKRGNRVRMATDRVVHKVRVAPQPERSSKAEVPGQMTVDVVSLRTRADLSGVDMWSRVFYRGRWYDLAAPPAYHRGTRPTRHWTITCRFRPGDGGVIHVA